MKRKTLILALVIVIAGAMVIRAEASISGRGSSWVNDHLVFGILSYCNTSEQEVRKLVAARIVYNRLLQDCGYSEFYVDENLDVRLDDLNEDWVKTLIDSIQIRFYDNLNSMVMALKSGVLDAIFVHDAVADYLCARDKELFYINKFVAEGDKEKVRGLLENGFHSDEFSFMLTEGNIGLRDEINKAINDMDNDGILTKLEEQFLSEQDPAPVKIDTIEGAETVKVAVTGDLPPFDYISENGVPAGYNTAVLAEIGKRIGKNIALVQVDTGGRAAALSSGMVDVVFWCRSQAVYSKGGYESGNDESLRKAIKALGMDKAKTEKALRLIELSFEESISMDQPDGTIITRPYHSSITKNVQKRKQPSASSSSGK